MRCGRSWENKEARCDRADPADEAHGSQWDHTVVDAETKLMVSLVIGPRTQANAEALWHDVAQRTDHGLPDLITTVEYRVYTGAILSPYGLLKAFPRPGQRGPTPHASAGGTEGVGLRDGAHAAPEGAGRQHHDPPRLRYRAPVGTSPGSLGVLAACQHELRGTLQ